VVLREAMTSDITLRAAVASSNRPCGVPLYSGRPSRVAEHEGSEEAGRLRCAGEMGDQRPEDGERARLHSARISTWRPGSLAEIWPVAGVVIPRTRESLSIRHVDVRLTQAGGEQLVVATVRAMTALFGPVGARCPGGTLDSQTRWC